MASRRVGTGQAGKACCIPNRSHTAVPDKLSVSVEKHMCRYRLYIGEPQHCAGLTAYKAGAMVRVMAAPAGSLPDALAKGVHALHFAGAGITSVGVHVIAFAVLRQAGAALGLVVVLLCILPSLLQEFYKYMSCLVILEIMSYEVDSQCLN